MILRIAPLLLLAPAACSQAPGAGEERPTGDMQTAQDLVECSLGGASAFARQCSLEWLGGDETTGVIVRHPGGGFRRFDITEGGLFVATADGAEAAETQVGEGALEVQVAGDRYRFPLAVMRDGGE